MTYDLLRAGLEAPICLTWEVTYACNLRCRHCLSASGKPAPGELDTRAAKRFIDEIAGLQVFYINVGGGEPLVRPDFRELMDHALDRGIGVKFSTNGWLLDDSVADWVGGNDYLDVQISLDGADAATNDAIRGRGSYERARMAMDRLAARDVGFKINMVLTKVNFDQLDRMYEMATSQGAQLRVTRFRPSGRGVRIWSDLHPTRDQNRELYEWLRVHPDVATGDSFFHLSALGEPLPGMNMCGAGRIVCLVDPVGDVYACPFLIDDRFKAGNIVAAGSFRDVWTTSPLFAHLRDWEVQGACRSCGAFGTCHGGCMAVKHFTGRDLDGPDPECVLVDDSTIVAREGELPLAVIA